MQPKFKVGDRVSVLSRTSGTVTGMAFEPREDKMRVYYLVRLDEGAFINDCSLFVSIIVVHPDSMHAEGDSE